MSKEKRNIATKLETESKYLSKKTINSVIIQIFSWTFSIIFLTTYIYLVIKVC